MKTRSKVGNKKGNPAYRTPSVFRAQKAFDNYRNKPYNKASSNESTWHPPHEKNI